MRMRSVAGTLALALAIATGAAERAQAVSNVGTLEVVVNGKFYSCVLTRNNSKVDAETLCWKGCESQPYNFGQLYAACLGACGKPKSFPVSDIAKHSDSSGLKSTGSAPSADSTGSTTTPSQKKAIK